jgi:hypothetical protein
LQRGPKPPGFQSPGGVDANGYSTAIMISDDLITAVTFEPAFIKFVDGFIRDRSGDSY